MAFPSGIYATYEGTSKNMAPRSLRNDFGDGYGQRAGDGINAEDETWTVKFELSVSDADTLETYFETQGSHTAFDWQPPREGSTRKFTVQGWARGFKDYSTDTVTAQFRCEKDL